MVYKYNIGDFETIKHCKPCEYWWVRYGVFCELKREWLDKLRDLLVKEKIILPFWKQAKGEMKGVMTPIKRRKEPKTPTTFEFDYFIDYECSYENSCQKDCPFYKESEWYKGYSLKQLQKMKGHEV